MSHAVDEQRAARKPTSSTSGPFAAPPRSGSKSSTLMMPRRTVSVTWLPISSAPANSITAAIAHAHWREREPAPTLVANAFATSLAPIPHAIPNARMPPTMTTHR